jgi:hypothetical protein
MSQLSTGASKIGPDVGKRSDSLFDPKKVYKFRHIQNAGLVRDRVDLELKKKFGFPPGRLLRPRDRQWTGKELNDYYESRPVTQAEFKAIATHTPAVVNIPKTNRKAQPKPKTTKRRASADHAAA